MSPSTNSWADAPETKSSATRITAAAQLMQSLKVAGKPTKPVGNSSDGAWSIILTVEGRLNPDAPSETPSSRWKPFVTHSAMIWKYSSTCIPASIQQTASISVTRSHSTIHFSLRIHFAPRTRRVSDDFGSRPRCLLPSASNSTANGRSEKSSKKTSWTIAVSISASRVG